MKRKTKKDSMMYSFLERQGVLETGDDVSIQNAKKQYWAEYRRNYKKIKRQKSKSFEVVFNFNEVKIITGEAKKYNTSPTNYIRKSALANNKNIIDQVAIGEIRELVVMHYTTLLTLKEENQLLQSTGNLLLEQASELEKKCLLFFHHLNNIK